MFPGFDLTVKFTHLPVDNFIILPLIIHPAPTGSLMTIFPPAQQPPHEMSEGSSIFDVISVQGNSSVIDFQYIDINCMA